MKQFIRIIFILQLAIIVACGGSNEKNGTENNNESTKKTETSNDVPQETEAPKIKEIQVTEKKVMNINELNKGDKIFGLTISEIDKKGEKDFALTLEDEFILSGGLNNSEEGIIFTAVDPTFSNAKLKMGNMQKPFFMWTTFNNKDEFLSALSAEQKSDAEQFKKVNIKIQLKNYQIIASSEAMWIGAKADFVKIIE